MKIKQIYNPKKVYDGWFESYFIKPWIRHYAHFRPGARPADSRRSRLAWPEMPRARAGLLMCLVGLMGPEVGFACLKWLGIAWLAASAIPFIALLARTFNGAEAQPRHPKFLGIDSLTVLSALLFFVFGVLLMYTTLHSETLHAPAGTPEDDEKVATDTVYEEALFTYQNPVIDTTATVADTMTDLSDPDLVTPDESFDPTIEPDPSYPTPQDTVNYF